ncbi:hypothetical protein VCUG_01172, partial [Vavraia culicis subsp. floridensis]
MHKLIDLIATNDIKGIETEMGRILTNADLESLSELLRSERTKIYFLILVEQLMKQFKLEGKSMAPLIALIERFNYPANELANKFASVYALAGTLDWPLHFPNFLDNVLSLMAGNDALGFNIFEKFLYHVRYGNEISEKRRKELKEALNISAERFSSFLIRTNLQDQNEIGIALICISIFEHLSTVLEFDPQIVLNAYSSFDLDSFIVGVLDRKQSDAFYNFLFSYLGGRPPNAKMLFALDRKSTPFLDYAVRGLISDEQCFLAALLYLRRRIGLLYDDDLVAPGSSGVYEAKMARICQILESIAERYDEADNYTRNEAMLFFIEVSRQQFDASFLNVEKVPRELLVQLLKNNEIASEDSFVQACNFYKKRDKRCFGYVEMLCTDPEGEKLMIKALDRVPLSEIELRNLIECIKSNKLYVKIATMIPSYNILGIDWNAEVAEKYFYYLQFDENGAMQNVEFFYDYFMKTDDFRFCFGILQRIRKVLARKNFDSNEEVIDSKIIERSYNSIGTVPVLELKYFIEFVGGLRCYSYFLEGVHNRVMKEWRDSEEWTELSVLTRIYLGVLNRYELVAPMIELLQIDEISLLRKILLILNKKVIPSELKPRCTYLLLTLYNSPGLTDLQGDVLNMLVDVYDDNTLLMVNNDLQALAEMRRDAKKRKTLMKAFLRNIKGQQLAELGRRNLAVGAQGIIKKEKAAAPDVDLNNLF